MIFELNKISELNQPLWLLLIIIPVLSYFYRLIVSRKILSTKYFDENMQHWYLNDRQSNMRSSKKFFLLDLLFWVFFSIALSGPQYPVTIDIDTSTSGNTLMVLLDASSSMNSTDESPTRLLRSKNELLNFIEQIKVGDRLGLILFSGSSHLLFPPTSDKVAMKFFVNQIQADMLPIAGSVISSAIVLASETLAKSSNDASNAQLLLISDGDIQDESAVLNKIENIELNVSLHALGVGKINQSPIPSYKDNKLWVTNQNNQVVTTNRNDGFLRDLSEIKDGTYTQLSENTSILDRIYKTSIKPIKYTNTKSSNTNWIQLYHFFLVIAVMLFFYIRIIKSGY